MLCWAADFHEMGNIHDICLLFTYQVSAAEPDTRHAILSLATKFNMFFFSSNVLLLDSQESAHNGHHKTHSKSTLENGRHTMFPIPSQAERYCFPPMLDTTRSRSLSH